MCSIVYLPLNVVYCLQMEQERDRATRLPECIPLFTIYQQQQQQEGVPANLIFLFKFTIKQEQAAAKTCIFAQKVL